MKSCSKCRELKPHSEFHSHAKKGDGLRSACKVCTVAGNKAARLASPYSKEQARVAQMKSKYGLTMENFDLMRSEQENACASCRDPFTKTPHIDHSHTTGRVRALLCSQCNMSLGLLKEDPTRIERLAAYAKLHASAQ